MGSKIEAQDIRRAFAARKGGIVDALGPLNMTVEDGDFVCMVGPSGCGKSTMLRVIGLLRTLQSFDASRWQTLRHLTIPMVMPDIFKGLRITTGMGVLVLVAIEMVQGASGLGYVIWSSWQVYDVERMYVGIVTMSLVGVALQYLVLGVGRLAMPWRASGKRS